MLKLTVICLLVRFSLKPTILDGDNEGDWDIDGDGDDDDDNDDFQDDTESIYVSPWRLPTW